MALSVPDPPWRRPVNPCPFFEAGNCVFAHRCNFVHQQRPKPIRAATYDPAHCPIYHRDRLLAREIAHGRWRAHNPDSLQYSDEDEEVDIASNQHSDLSSDDARSPTSALLKPSRSGNPSDDSSLSQSAHQPPQRPASPPNPPTPPTPPSPLDSPESSEPHGIRSFRRHRTQPTIGNVKFLASLSEKIEKRFNLTKAGDTTKVPADPAVSDKKHRKKRNRRSRASRKEANLEDSVGPSPVVDKPPEVAALIAEAVPDNTTVPPVPLKGIPQAPADTLPRLAAVLQTLVAPQDVVQQLAPSAGDETPASTIKARATTRASHKSRHHSDATTVRDSPRHSQAASSQSWTSLHTALPSAAGPLSGDDYAETRKIDEATIRPLSISDEVFQPDAESTEMHGRTSCKMEDSLFSLYGDESIALHDDPEATVFPLSPGDAIDVANNPSVPFSNDQTQSYSDNLDFWTVPNIVDIHPRNAEPQPRLTNSHKRLSGLRPLRLPIQRSNSEPNSLGTIDLPTSPPSGQLLPPAEHIAANSSPQIPMLLRLPFRPESQPHSPMLIDQTYSAQPSPAMISESPRSLENGFSEPDARLVPLRRTLASPFYSDSKRSNASQSRRSSLLSATSRRSSVSPGAKLYFAIARDSPNEVASLLENGEATAHEQLGPEDALTFAANNRQLQRRGEIVSLLISHGADLASITRTNQEPEENQEPELDPYIEYFAFRAQEPRQIYFNSIRKVAKFPKFAPLGRVPFGVIGQDLVLNEFFRAIAMQELSSQTSPLVFFLCGPSGHGKSLFARKIGEALDCPARTFNLTLLRHQEMIWDLSSLEDDDAQSMKLAEYLQENDSKRCIVVLDEVEKTSNAQTLWPLLVPWEFGHVTLGNGSNIKARDTIWIATSNLGQDYILAAANSEHGPLVAEQYRQLMTQSRDVFSQHFGSSLVSRVTAVLPFTTFDDKELRALAFKFLAPHLTPEMDRSREEILDQVVAGYRREEGARSLQRAAASVLLDL